MTVHVQYVSKILLILSFALVGEKNQLNQQKEIFNSFPVKNQILRGSFATLKLNHVLRLGNNEIFWLSSTWEIQLKSTGILNRRMRDMLLQFHHQIFIFSSRTNVFAKGVSEKKLQLRKPSYGLLKTNVKTFLKTNFGWTHCAQWHPIGLDFAVSDQFFRQF